MFVLQWRSEIGEILYRNAGDELVSAKYKPFYDMDCCSSQSGAKKPKVTDNAVLFACFASPHNNQSNNDNVVTNLITNSV